jgi:hypothetical protein
MQLASLVAFGLSGVLALAFALRYLRTREFMPYHAAVLGKPWSALEPRLQAIILGMLKVAGGGLLGFGCTLLWLLLPLQRGETWAAWAALTISLAVATPILYVVLWLRRVSPGASTPVVPTVAVVVLAVAGTLAFFAARV